jgi:hypothetical protein
MSRPAAGRLVRQPANGTTIMTRSILIAAVVGVLVAVPTSYFLTAPVLQDRAATPARTGNAVSETVTPALFDHGIDGRDSGLGSARSRLRGR